jgi:uncharacterized membrane protein
MSDTTLGALDGAQSRPDPQVREITVDDISAALAAGMRDFRAAPTFGLVFGGLYAVGGLALVYALSSLELVFLAYPLAAGFAIVAPLVAVGLYEVSRLIEAGTVPTWGAVLAAIPHHGRRELGFMALVAVFGLIAWVYTAGFLYAVFFGMQPYSFGELVTAVVSTPRGIAFFMLGNLLGAVIALTLFSVSVVAYPLLIDRDIDFVTAMITSIRAVVASPGPMIGWGIFIGTMLGIAILPMFLGLFVVLPLLGHATWHLYRKAVAA